MLAIHEFCEKFARVSGRIMVVGVSTGFFLRTALATVPTEHVSIEVEVPMLVFVKMGLHLCSAF